MLKVSLNDRCLIGHALFRLADTMEGKFVIEEQTPP